MLNKYLRIQLLLLSKKYDIYVVEITKANDNKLTKNYTINYRIKSDEKKFNRQTFGNKKQLVSWLMCLD